MNNSEACLTTQTKRHASDDRNREACLSSWGMPLGRNKELLYKVCEIANTVCRVSFLSSLLGMPLGRTG